MPPTSIPHAALAFVAVAIPQDRFPAREHIQPGAADHIVIAAGDLDGDGRDDLVATSGLPVLHVYRGKETHGLQPSGTVPLPAPAVALDLGDVDGDGDLDVAFSTVGKVAVALGDGSGGLSAPQTVGFITDCADLATGDVDADGREDIVVLSRANSLVKTFLAAPLGGFLPPQSSNLGKLPRGFELGDLNGDGVLDLVLASSGNVRVVSAIGDGNGGFSKLQAVTMDSGPAVSVVLGDLDLDGVQDVIAGTMSGVFYSLRGLGDGTFESQSKKYQGGHAADLIDWNEDGYLDVASAWVHKGIYVHMNDKGGLFEGPALVPSPETAFAVASCDGDGDGHLDIAFGAISVGFEPWTVHETMAGLINGNGESQVKSIIGIPADGPSFHGESLVVEDLDGDGIQDLAGLGHLPTGGLGSILVRRGDGTGGLLPSEVYPLPGVTEFATGDVNGDGLQDLVAHAGKGVSVFEATFSGFKDPLHLTLPSHWTRIAVGDMDGDGDDDIVASAFKRMMFWRSHGDGTFDAPVVSALPSNVLVHQGPNAPFGFVNLDGDATLDLVLSDMGSSRLYALRGLPSGRFMPWGPTEVQFGVVHVLFVDLDGDAMEEFVVSKPTLYAPSLSSTLYVHSSDGSGNLPLQAEFEIGPNPILSLPCDVDGDGFVDLLTLLQYGEFAWIKGDGAGGFDPPTRFASRGVPIGVGDLNGDGREDLFLLPWLPLGGQADLSFVSVLQH